MATGYTVQIEEGITFKEFVLICARAFGACISMRDDPIGKEIPNEIVPSTYHLKEIESAKNKIQLLSNLSLIELTKEAKLKFKKDIDYYNESIKKNKELKEKYENMLCKVNMWNPPTKDHVNLKEFMIKQIEDSIQFDCYAEKYMEKPILQTGKEWFAEQMELVKRDLQYHVKENEKEIKRCKERTKWIQDLKNSLKEEE